MDDANVFRLIQPSRNDDPLTDVLPDEAAKLLACAIEAEVEAHLPRYTNQIVARYMPNAAKLAIPEKALIDHGLKWWPSKQYESTFTDKGTSSQWRLEVTSLVRAEAIFPAEGVPVAVLLTIEDT